MPENIEHLKAIYEEKQAAYNKLCDAYSKAAEAANEIKAMCDAAMADLHEAGQQLLKAMEAEQQ